MKILSIMSSTNEYDQFRLNRHHKALLETIPNSWMLRECSVYKDEYKGCSGIKGKLHSYYVTGKVDQCEDWKQNYADCKLWVDKSDTEAAKRIIDREHKRIYERLKGHCENDVWETRSPAERPPEDWNKPLPEHLADMADDSYLKQYKENLEKGNTEPTTNMQLRALTTNSCNIL